MQTARVDPSGTQLLTISQDPFVRVCRLPKVLALLAARAEDVLRDIERRTGLLAKVPPPARPSTLDRIGDRAARAVRWLRSWLPGRAAGSCSGR